jgi:AcrR family transcriptional regulator
MTGAVKTRPYDNSRRRAMVAATKSRVVEAASALFLERGYATTTVELIAEASGVPQATIYRLFESKVGIFKAVLDISFVGDDRPVALHERAPALHAAAQRDPRRLIEGFAAVCRAVLERSGAMQAVLRGAAAADPEVAALLADINKQRLRGQMRVAHLLGELDALRPGVAVAEAADVIYGLMAPELHHIFRTQRRWSAQRYERWLADTLCRSLL